jgi:hypothetical protein
VVLEKASKEHSKLTASATRTELSLERCYHMYPIVVDHHSSLAIYHIYITVFPNFNGILIIMVIIEGAFLSYGYHGISHL